MTIKQRLIYAGLTALALSALSGAGYAQDSDGWYDLEDLEPRSRAASSPASGNNAASNNNAANSPDDDGWVDLDSLTPAQDSSRDNRAVRTSPSRSDEGWRDLETESAAIATDPEPQARPHWSQNRIDVWESVDAETAAPTERYLWAGDTIDIVFAEAETLSGEYTLSDTGVVTLPLIGGLRAEGQTAQAFAAVLEQIYGVDYLVDPTITVSPRASVIGQITVKGLVNAPRAISITQPQSLAEIINQAGGPRGGRASKDAVIKRNKDGKTHARRVSLDNISLAGNSGLTLLAGDEVNIIEKRALPDITASSSQFPRLGKVLSGGSAVQF